MAAFEAVSNIVIETVDEREQQHHAIDISADRLKFGKAPESDFDPREHRNPIKPIRPWMAYFNIARVAFGVGVLGMPMAISQAGIILGPVLIVAIGVLVCHMHLTLLWCLNEISRRMKIPYISYRYGFRLAMLHGPPIFHGIGNHGPKIIAFFMVLSQLGLCTISVLLSGDNVRDLLDFQSILPGLISLYIPYMVMEVLMKNLKVISYVSTIGNIVNLIGVALIFFAIFRDPHGEIKPAGTTALAVFTALGIMLFNISAIGPTLSCEKALQNPKIMSSKFGVIPVGIIVPSFFSCIIGSLGYWAFGTMDENILRSLQYDDPVTMVTFFLYLFGVSMAYPIQSYPGVQIILEVIKNYDPLVKPTKPQLQVIEFLLRPIFVTATFTIAYFLPFQASLVAFVGNLCTSMLSLVFPALMEMCLLYPYEYGPYYYLLFKDLFIAGLGISIWVFGVGLCAYHLYILVLSFKSPNSEFL